MPILANVLYLEPNRYMYLWNNLWVKQNYSASLCHAVVSVFLTFLDTANEGDDYIPPASTTVTLDAGQTSGTCQFDIVNDGQREGDETMSVEISDFTSGTYISVHPGTIQTDVTIQDDDGKWNIPVV